MKHQADVTVIGSGFAGSILAWILSRQGLRVALVDAAAHPRFAIGESSTPIADMLLKQLGTKYDLEPLRSLSKWGSWQSKYPKLPCGLKRGFSYYLHRHGQPFQEAFLGESSLLVAASPHDAVADTHWYRPEVDHFLHTQACAAGCADFSRHRVVSIENHGDASLVHCWGTTETSIESRWVIDASGRSSVFGKLLPTRELTDQLRTRTHSTFAHYRNVGSWNQLLRDQDHDCSLNPFNPDDAAQHHLLAGGWMWMLRFNNGITSVGYTAGCDTTLDWTGYPSMDQLFRDAKLVAPAKKPIVTDRLQRLLDPVVNPYRLMLPTAAVTLDPLHSTGIAHGLAGVDRIASLILGKSGSLEEYRESVLAEALLLDQLISTAYQCMHQFSRFTAACMLYFAAAIACEERLQAGESLAKLWNADDVDFQNFVGWACEELKKSPEDPSDQIRLRLAKWNSAGLMNIASQNRYAYTAAQKP